MLLDSLGRLGAHLDLPTLREPRDAGGQVCRRAGCGEGPAAAAAGIQLRRADQRRAAVDPDVDGHGRVDPGELLVELDDLAEELEGRARSVLGMARAVPLALEDHHEPVARGLVDVAVVGPDDLEEAREVGLDHPVELLGRELLGQARVAFHVEEQDRHVRLALLELTRVRVLLEQALHGLGHELG